jgi:hypothetical protein
LAEAWGVIGAGEQCFQSHPDILPMGEALGEPERRWRGWASWVYSLGNECWKIPAPDLGLEWNPVG